MNIKDKIKKLLALSSSENEHEASVALQKASELMLSHNVSKDELRDDPFLGEVKFEEVHYIFNDNADEALIYWIAEAFGARCVDIIDTDYGQLFGTKATRQTTLLMYEYACNTINKLTAAQELHKSHTIAPLASGTVFQIQYVKRS